MSWESIHLRVYMVEWNPTDFHPIVPKKLQILDRLKPNKYRETQWSNSKVALTLRAFCITWERTEEETFLQNSVCRCTCLLRREPILPTCSPSPTTCAIISCCSDPKDSWGRLLWPQITQPITIQWCGIQTKFRNVHMPKLFSVPLHRQHVEVGMFHSFQYQCWSCDFVSLHW